MRRVLFDGLQQVPPRGDWGHCKKKKNTRKYCKNLKGRTQGEHVLMNLLSSTHMGSQRVTLLNWAHTGSQSEGTSMGHAWVCPRFSVYMLWLLAWFCVEMLTVDAGASLILLPDLGTLFFLLCCPVHPRYEGFCLVLLYLVLSCFIVVSWRPTFFLKGSRRGVDLGKR